MISGGAIDVILVYQVPIMIAAGLSTGAAATVAGVRGFAQVGGRLALPPFLNKLGPRLTTVVALVVAVAATLLLLGSKHIPLAAGYCLLSGGVARSRSSRSRASTQTNSSATKTSACSWGLSKPSSPSAAHSGPLIAATLLERTHSYTPVILLTAAGLSVAALLLSTNPRPATQTNARPSYSEP